jgi:integrase
LASNGDADAPCGDPSSHSVQPLKTDQFRRRLYKLMAIAGVRKVTPYDMRHSCLTYLAPNGVPDVVVSAWAGHADLSLAKRVCVHPDETHLAPAATALNALANSRDKRVR